jgi:hypothetical protein
MLYANWSDDDPPGAEFTLPEKTTEDEFDSGSTAISRRVADAGKGARNLPNGNHG